MATLEHLRDHATESLAAYAYTVNDFPDRAARVNCAIEVVDRIADYSSQLVLQKLLQLLKEASTPDT